MEAESLAAGGEEMWILARGKGQRRRDFGGERRRRAGGAPHAPFYKGRERRRREIGAAEIAMAVVHFSVNAHE